MTAPAAATTRFVLRLEEVLVRTLRALLTAIFAFIFVLVVVLVVLRYGFNATIVGGSEAAVMLFIYTTALGAAVDIARGKHIRIDSLIGLLPARGRRWVEMLDVVLIGGLHVFLFIYSLDWISVVGGSRDPVLHTPEALVEVAIPIGCLFAVLFCLTRLVALALAPPQDDGVRPPCWCSSAAWWSSCSSACRSASRWAFRRCSISCSISRR